MSSSSPVVSAASPATATTTNNNIPKPKRPPAPTLFVGPPSASRNASQLSILRPSTTADPAFRNNAPTGIDPAPSSSSYRNTNNTQATSTKPQLSNSRQQASIFSPAGERDLETRWRAMQSTLSAVERTAHPSAATHVFSDGHTRALDDLRDAQILLARAWGRGSEDRHHHQFPGGENDSGEATPTSATAAAPADEISAGPTLHRPQQSRQHGPADLNPGTTTDDSPTTSTSTALPSEPTTATTSTPPPFSSAAPSLEDATARDIQRANERRAANEEYFRKVATGVREVVGRLEGVAEAMRKVEGESRGLWDEAGSERTGSSSAGTVNVDGNGAGRR
ncbi:uncharacterized protein K489DRAFT_379244 [Dissoconium aciculare CBS 342.82]|uniref:Uncharacterized protein n=1 Tax=Dissoconium aciculare CBS 342.82 TaxID=1314786 RepID=A0A6J3M5W1_9PEZI|nr:uncharacterized protein K489DRAFT_379244 [Dissoconium aciculare CBS 342.82]KAF1823268.1 hypothetical protein K489DRAFT_379244 [Dissoconium aciculare CBS 342.82]